MTAVGRIGQHLARLGLARAAAAFLLGVVGALMLLMLAAVFHATRFDTAATQPVNLGQWEQSPVPLRAPLPLSETPGLWLLRGDVSLHNARIKEQPRASADTIEAPFAVPLHSVERIVISGARLWLNAGREPRSASLAPENVAVIHLLEPLQRLAFETLILQGASLTTQRLAGGQQTIEKLDAEIRATPGRGATSASGQFQHRGEQVDFEASLQPVRRTIGAVADACPYHGKQQASVGGVQRHRSVRSGHSARWPFGIARAKPLPSSAMAGPCSSRGRRWSCLCRQGHRILARWGIGFRTHGIRTRRSTCAGCPLDRAGHASSFH